MTETQIAQHLHEHAIREAHKIAGPGDLQAVTLTVLMHALTLATPDLSAERRASLFLAKEEE